MADRFLQAVDCGDEETVKELINDNGAVKEVAGERTAIHRAAGYGHTSVVLELIAAGYNPLAASHTGRIPLHDACQGGHVGVLQELLTYGGLELTDKRGQTPLHVAAYHGEAQCAQLLCSNSADIGSRDEESRTPAHLAAMMNQSSTLQRLVDCGADIDVPDVHGRTCSHYAATVPDSSSLKVLFHQGVDLQVRCSQGRLPIHYCVLHDRLSNLQVLLTQHTKNGGHDNIKQARINLLESTDRNGKSLSHLAAHTGSIASLHWMLEQGVDPNCRDNNDGTPLHSASSKSQILAYSCLLYHGADQEALNKKGDTAMEVARKVGKPIAMGRAVSGESRCPKCRQKGLDQDWELKNAPSDIIVTIESTKDLLFGGQRAEKKRHHKKSSGSVTSLISFSSSSTSSLPKRNMATKFYGEFL